MVNAWLEVSKDWASELGKGILEANSLVSSGLEASKELVIFGKTFEVRGVAAALDTVLGEGGLEDE